MVLVADGANHVANVELAVTVPAAKPASGPEVYMFCSFGDEDADADVVAKAGAALCPEDQL
eukprot:3906441-Amphidinium_carterae.1